MQDFMTFPGEDRWTQLFQTGTADWFEWVKPRGVQTVNILAIGGGGGGGGGSTNSTGTVRGGGGGGGTGGMVRVTGIPAMFLPDVLYVQPGIGGGGGNAGATGVTGTAGALTAASGKRPPAAPRSPSNST